METIRCYFNSEVCDMLTDSVRQYENCSVQGLEAPVSVIETNKVDSDRVCLCVC